MPKRGSKKLNKVLTIASFLLILVLANIYFYSRNKGGDLSYILDSSFFPELIRGLSNFEIIPIVFSIQILLILVMVIGLLIDYFVIRKKKEDKEKKKVKKEKKFSVRKKSNETDIDVLARILKKNKSINVKDVSYHFGVDEKKVLEWGRIMEENKMVEIDYPVFSGPVINLKDKEKEDKEYKNAKEKKEK